MKKSFFALIVVMSFALASTSVFAQYSEEEIAAANLVRKVVKVNGIQNPNLIFPKQVINLPFPNDEDRLMYVVVKDDELLKIAKMVNAGEYNAVYHLTPELQKPDRQKFSNSSVVVTPKELEIGNESTPFWLFLFIVCLVILISYLFFKLIKTNNEKEKITNKINNLANSNKTLEMELERTKNKLPIIAPEIVDEKWLKSNYPIDNVAHEFMGELSQSTITRVFGKKPDLIATALVSTKANALSMEFSHNRKSVTGLKDVLVHLGWNWDAEAKDWLEVGMVASVCSNGFQMNPEKIVKTDNLFTKIGVADKERRPVTFVAPDVPNDAHYPSLLKTLMIEYHRENILDLRKSGLTIDDLNKKN